jgi:hypothetical protein
MQQAGPTIPPPFQEEQPPPAPDWLGAVFDPACLHLRRINYVRVEPLDRWRPGLSLRTSSRHPPSPQPDHILSGMFGGLRES